MSEDNAAPTPMAWKWSVLFWWALVVAAVLGGIAPKLFDRESAALVCEVVLVAAALLTVTAGALDIKAGHAKGCRWGTWALMLACSTIPLAELPIPGINSVLIVLAGVAGAVAFIGGARDTDSNRATGAGALAIVVMLAIIAQTPALNQFVAKLFGLKTW